MIPSHHVSVRVCTAQVRHRCRAGRASRAVDPLHPTARAAPEPTVLQRRDLEAALPQRVRPVHKTQLRQNPHEPSNSTQPIGRSCLVLIDSGSHL